jgi:hypothetical protein
MRNDLVRGLGVRGFFIKKRLGGVLLTINRLTEVPVCNTFAHSW